jgi:hypothetical protein
MRKFTFLLFVVFLSFTWQTNAQVTIGTGTTTGQGLPIEPFYDYSYSQVIYLQSEIGAPMNIAEIIYAKTVTGSLSNSQDWVVYMGHTTKTQFDSTSDWVDISTLTQVYSGTVSSNSGVVNILLDTPFSYNGTDNLIIAVDENTSGYDTTTDDFYCTVTPSGANRGILYRDINTNPNPVSPPTASFLRSYFANISLTPASDCSVPTDIEVTPSGTNANVTWLDSNDPPPENWEYELVNVTAGGTATGTATGTFASSPGSLSSLIQGIDYQILMRSVCISGSDYSTWSSPVSWHQPLVGDVCSDPITGVINTDCADVAAVKYNLDFSLAQNQGSISCSNGNDVYGYWFSISVTSSISLRINNAEVGTNVGMLVGLDCSMTPELTCQMVGTSINATDVEAETYYILFWSESQSGTTEICLESVPCMAPQELESSYVGSNSTNIYWDAPTSATQVEWEVTETGQTTVVDNGTTTDNNTDVVGLEPDTDYTFKIRSDCSGGVYSDWNYFEFTTNCAAPTPVTVESYTNNEVTFSWGYNPDATACEYDVRPSGDQPPNYDDSGNLVNASPTTDEGLGEGTSYDIYIRTVCGDGTFSDWSGPTTFTTFDYWNNLQWPNSGEIDVSNSYAVYAQIYRQGVTEGSGQGTGIEAWIGYSNDDTNPNTWTNWVVADYNSVVTGNNDEYMKEIGSGLAPGTYYYASRFRVNGGDFSYGGLNGYWDNDSGFLQVNGINGDICGNAIEVNVADSFESSAIVATNVNAYPSDENSDPSCGDFGNGNDVWFFTTVPVSGDFTVETQVNSGSTLDDTVMAIYSGTGCEALTEIACDDNGGNGNFSKISFSSLNPGDVLYIRVFESGTDVFDTFKIGVYDVSLSYDDSYIDGFNLFPNPITNTLNLKATDTITNLNIYNMLGQLILQEQPNSNQISIETDNLLSGTYIIKVQTPSQIGTYNFIKH